MQIWTGLFARTAPNWSLLLRAPANLPVPGGFSHYEGIIEADRWFGPVFTNLRLTRTGVPLRLTTEMPLLQIQPLPRLAYAEATLDSTALVDSPRAFAAADWDDYAASIAAPSANPDRAPGTYAVSARRRRKAEGCPFAAAHQ